MRVGKTAFVGALLLLFSACGYRLATRKGDIGANQTIAVPTFVNTTTSFRIEQVMSEAVRKELARTTHYRVISGEGADVVVWAEVLSFSRTPTVFDDHGRAAQYAIGVILKVVVTETSTGKALFQNASMTFRDTFQLSQDQADFAPEDPAALDRLAARFASTIVAALVHGQP
jgi:hypothetical protein